MNLANAIKFLSDPQYRIRRKRNISEYKETERLRRMERGVPGVTLLSNRKVYFSDARTFIGSRNEIFNRGIYKFNSPSETPFIIDAGANVGMSVLYFKQLYPRATVLAFEPDPGLFGLLTRNISSFELEDVTAYPYALWHEETEIDFWSEGKEAGRVQPDADGNCKVKSRRLSSYIRGRVDFLKIDIEGAETVVLEECGDKLQLVDKLFVEYHSFEGQPQELSRLVRLLEQAGFRLFIQDNLRMSESPFCHIDKYQNIDMLLNIFAFRV